MPTFLSSRQMRRSVFANFAPTERHLLLGTALGPPYFQSLHKDCQITHVTVRGQRLFKDSDFAMFWRSHRHRYSIMAQSTVAPVMSSREQGPIEDYIAAGMGLRLDLGQGSSDILSSLGNLQSLLSRIVQLQKEAASRGGAGALEFSFHLSLRGLVDLPRLLLKFARWKASALHIELLGGDDLRPAQLGILREGLRTAHKEAQELRTPIYLNGEALSFRDSGAESVHTYFYVLNSEGKVIHSISGGPKWVLGRK